MKFLLLLCLVPCLSVATLGATAPTAALAIPDPRHLANGFNIPSEGYANQPYIVRTDDGAWLCAITTGTGVEGATGQHVVSVRSRDQGRTWERAVDIGPANGPAAPYGVLLKVPGGRVYAFYKHNTDRVPEVKREDCGVYKRVDSLGDYVFRFSDDHGRTWSPQRYAVPIREFAIDRANIYGGSLRFFWNVGRPLVLTDAVIGVIHKVGAMGVGFFAQSEGAFWRSQNILTERDPTKITFETLPDGDVGLSTPIGGGRVAEEQSVVALSDGSLYCVYRTVDGWPACAYSRDGGRTWTPPAYASTTPDGPRLKHLRAANFVWKAGNGKFLYWFHNHGGAFIAQKHADTTGRSGSPYDDRNPAWLVVGVERDSPGGKVIHWSQPEIALYEDDPFIRMSYADLVEEGGKFFLTETQKDLRRVHKLPAALGDGLFNQFEHRTVATAQRALNLVTKAALKPEVPMPALPALHTRDTRRPDHGDRDLRAAFSLDFTVQLAALTPGQILLDNRTATGQALHVITTAAGPLRLVLNDGREESAWECDRGVLNDGGTKRQFGWGRFSPTLCSANGAPTLELAPTIRALRIYPRALRTSEAVGKYRAGLAAKASSL